ncbi:MAG: hypothetical protein IJ246_01155 [Clostridia bacterium]|nr:hypothetical protein [Clostridia bacterium]
MAVTYYCKHCKKDVPAGESCPHCGEKLSASSAHLRWSILRHPLGDWFSWNRFLRLLIPVFLLVLLLALITEGIGGGLYGIEALLRSGFMQTLGLLFLLLCLLIGLFLLLRGNELLDCTVDSRGIHIATFVPSPTALSLLLRGKSPKMLQNVKKEGEEAIPCVEERKISWNEIRRVQVWSEKSTILFYAPSYLLRLPLPCTPYSFPDTLDMIRDRLGKKKQVILPRSLRPVPPKTDKQKRKATPSSSKKSTEKRELTPEFLEEIQKMNAYDEAAARKNG